MTDEKGLYGIYDVWHVPFWQTPLFYTILALISFFIVVTVLLLVVRWYYARAQQKKIDPWDKALAVLDQLKEQEYATTERSKFAYFTITAVLKEYLNDRYRFDVQGKTDDELFTYLQKHNFKKELLVYLQDILDGGVMVKFANEQAIQDQVRRHITVACMFVTQTIDQSSLH